MLTEETVLGQMSWVMRSKTVNMSLTQVGSQMAPVYFDLPGQPRVQPYHISPWQGEDHACLDGRSEGPLRGDFFCLPFGASDPDDEAPAHGKTASRLWSLGGHRCGKGVHELDIRLENALKSAGVRRQFFLIEDHTIVYDRTTISGLTGAYTLGHHAILSLPSRDSALLLSTSKQMLGMTCPTLFASPAIAEYQSLAVGASFEELSSVPSIFKGTSDANCSVFPERRGFTDLLQIAVDVEKGKPAWTAAVNTEGSYLWFSLRNPSLLPSTIVWIDNRGRHQPPWSGRNCSLGLEDTCSFFDKGSKASRQPNAFSKAGVKTIHNFEEGSTMCIPYLQGVAPIPPNFSHVRSAVCGEAGLTLADSAGREVFCAARTQFVFGEEL